MVAAHCICYFWSPRCHTVSLNISLQLLSALPNLQSYFTRSTSFLADFQISFRPFSILRCSVSSLGHSTPVALLQCDLQVRLHSLFTKSTMISRYPQNQLCDLSIITRIFHSASSSSTLIIKYSRNSMSSLNSRRISVPAFSARWRIPMEILFAHAQNYYCYSPDYHKLWTLLFNSLRAIYFNLPDGVIPTWHSNIHRAPH